MKIAAVIQIEESTTMCQEDNHSKAQKRITDLWKYRKVEAFRGAPQWYGGLLWVLSRAKNTIYSDILPGPIVTMCQAKNKWWARPNITLALEMVRVWVDPLEKMGQAICVRPNSSVVPSPVAQRVKTMNVFCSLSNSIWCFLWMMSWKYPIKRMYNLQYLCIEATCPVINYDARSFL